MLKEFGLVKKTAKVKVLGRGKLARPLNVTVHGFSESARKAIEEAGGTATTI